MTIDKKMKYEIQAGVKNYKPSEMVTVPRTAKSSPTHPTAHLAYITDKEKKLLIKKNLHGSLKGKPNRGPGGIPSLQGDFGGPEGFGGFRGGGDYSSAETGNFSGFDGTGGGPELPPGVDKKPSKEAQDIRSAAIVAGAGQRVNPGFFDSRDTVSPIEMARARAYARDRNNLFARGAMRNTRGGGLMGFFTSGGLLGNLVRGLGRRFGLGKDFDEPTYDMRQFSGINPTFQNDLDNELALSTVGNINTVAPLAVNNRVRPNVNLLAQPTYNLDGTVRNDAFDYFDLPGGYFDTNTNNRNINEQIVPGGILDNVDIIDMRENENFGPMA
jgi:hypothetical protein